MKKIKFKYFLLISFFIHFLIFLIIPLSSSVDISKPVKIKIISQKIEKKKNLVEKNKTKTKDIKLDEKITENIKENKTQDNKEIISENNEVETYEFGDFNGPKIDGVFSPKYPYIMKKLGKEGRVVLKLLIDENGNLLSYEVLESTNNDFLNSVLNELKKIKFIAANKNGFSVKCYAILPVSFKLER